MERAANKKTKRIFSKIFNPIVLIVVVYAIAAFLINYFSIDRFVKENAKEKLEEAYRDVVSQVSAYSNSDGKEFVLEPSEYLVSQSNNSQVYVFDKNYNEVSLFDNSIYIDKEMVSFLSSLLMDYELEEGIFTNITFNNKEYIANTYVAGNNLNINEKYFVVIQELTGKYNLLRESSIRLLLIQILMLMLVLITVFIVTRDISRPIIKLSNESREYIIGKGCTIDKNSFNTTELETLRQSLINMQNKIDKETNRKNTVYENVAHDLRTPLVSILGYADGLKSGIIKDKNKACDIILRTGNQLKEMIENILVLSRFDNDTYKGSFEEIDLNDIIIEQVETIKVIDEKKKVIFENEASSQALIKSDRKLLIRIIQNLLSNAIKYANEKVIVELEEINVGKYRISVCDDGRGIDKDNISNIFTRYYKGVDGHFGIGLAVVKNAIDFLGADIDIESSENTGTKFIIII